jgi:DNA polymerase
MAEAERAAWKDQVIATLRALERRGIRAIYRLPADPSRSEEAAIAEEETKGAAVSREGEATRDRATGIGETSREGKRTKADRLGELAERVAACRRCALAERRTQTVFGVGDPDSPVMFIGEAPGREEDRRGEPFVGQAGKLLDRILEAAGFGRSRVYIANVLKCRPPENRDPTEEEVRECEVFLAAQIDILRPKLICALGRIAGQWLLHTKAPLSALRLGTHEFRGVPVVVTYHPAALLRNPKFKRPTWEDFLKMRELLEELAPGWVGPIREVKSR